MRNVNLDPFWRTTVGFDRLFDLMDESLRYEPEDHYPPCNIVRTGEDSYRISLAVAGFKPGQINVTVHQNTLIVSGRPQEKPQGETEYLYRGIAGRPFEPPLQSRRLCRGEAGFLRGRAPSEIELKREIPEALKPRKIDVQVGKAHASGDQVTTIEHAKVA